jgi:hypothetical protein
VPEETRVEFTQTLSDPERATLAALGTKPAAEAAAAVAALALGEWIAWLGADDRPASLTELAKRRIKAMVDAEVLPARPTAAVIAQRARLTLGQARYISAALALESPGASAEAKAGLADRLEGELTRSGVADPAHLTQEQIDELLGDDNPNLRFFAPRADGELAKAQYDEHLNERFNATGTVEINRFEPPSVKRRSDSYVSIEIPRNVAATLLRRLRGPGA